MGSAWFTRVLTVLIAPLACAASAYLLLLFGWYAVIDAREGPIWGAVMWAAIGSLIPVGGWLACRAGLRRGETGHVLVLGVSVLTLAIAMVLAVCLGLLSVATTGF